MEFFTWVIEAFAWVVDAIGSCFVRNDKEWSVGRIVTLLAVVIAIVLVAYWLYR
jgi:hypothetical protein